MMGQHENRNVIWRIRSPPAFPAFIRPRATDWAEHVPAKNPSPQICGAPCSKVVIDACGSLILAIQHPLECSRRIEPAMQCRPADAQRIVNVLVRPRTVAIEGYRKIRDAKFSHLRVLLLVLAA